MADIVDAATRSRMMSGIRSRNTKPELLIRRGLHGLGFRFRLHARKLAGTPDLVLSKYRAVIFVHGCFWHAHGCGLFRMPASRPEFWSRKFERNRLNDRVAQERLLADGWRVLTVWECALRDRSDAEISTLLARIARWLQASRRSLEIGKRESGAA